MSLFDFFRKKNVPKDIPKEIPKETPRKKQEEIVKDLLAATEIPDPYWLFDAGNHFRPKLNKGSFFRLEGFDFGWFVLEPISIFVKTVEGEFTRGQQLSYGQKALYYWWYIDAQVRNGGFTQFYYNGYGRYVPTIIKGLRHIGDNQMADLVERAESVYKKNAAIINEAREKEEFFGSDLYKRLNEFDSLSSQYYKMNDRTMDHIVGYVRQHPNEFCVDEEGKEFDMTFTGETTSHYPNNQVKEIFTIEKGIINGPYKSFYENGSPREVIHYLNGRLTGDRESYSEDGSKKSTARRLDDKQQIEHISYYENGKPKKLEHRRIDNNELIGEYKEWHENGQLADTCMFIGKFERDGKWLRYFPDGRMKFEAEFVKGQYLIQNCWSENGEQTLKDGTGLHVLELVSGKRITRYENRYKDFKKHGQQHTYRNGILTLLEEMENGKVHGITRSFYNNGSLEQETVYENDVVVSRKQFEMFKNPVVVTEIKCSMEDQWLTNRNLPTADAYPKPKNASELEDNFNAPLSLLEGYNQDSEVDYQYFVDVDENGNATGLQFLMASNLRVREKVEETINALKFEPATKDGKNVPSHVSVRVTFRRVDKP